MKSHQIYSRPTWHTENLLTDFAVDIFQPPTPGGYMVVGVDGRRGRITFIIQIVIQALVEFSVVSNKAVTQ